MAIDFYKLFQRTCIVQSMVIFTVSLGFKQLSPLLIEDTLTPNEFRIFGLLTMRGGDPPADKQSTAETTIFTLH